MSLSSSPLLASDMSGILPMIVMSGAWTAAGILAVIALILACWRAARRASLGFAMASIMSSVVVWFALIGLVSTRNGGETIDALGVLILFVPLAIALPVAWFDRRSLGNERK
jgi:hypothetical protein